MKYTATAVLLILSMLAAGTHVSAQPPRLVIYDFTIGGGRESLPREVKRDFPDTLRQGLVESGLVEVLERDEWAKLWLEKSNAEEFPDSFDQATVVEIGKQLLASHVVLGRITKYADLIQVSARIVDIETGKIISEERVTFSAEVAPYSPLRRLSDQLLMVWKHRSSVGGGESRPLSLAVTLPTNISMKDKERHDWIGRGIMSTFNSKLDDLEGKLVVARREDVIRHGGQDVASISRQLRVDALLIGDYQVLGDNIRVNLQVVDGKTGNVLAKASRTDARENLFKLQDGLVIDITRDLNIRLSSQEEEKLAQHPTTSLTAYEYFSKGLQSFDEGRFHEAGDLFSRALEVDPQYVDARYYLGRTYSETEQYDKALLQFDLALGDASTKEFGDLIWALKTPEKIYWGTPRKWRDILYFQVGSEYLYAVEAATGALKWKFELPLGTEYSPTLGDGVVYLGSEDGQIYAVDAVSGKPEWTHEVDGEVVSITTHGSHVYVGTAGDPPTIRSIHLPTRNTQWVTELSGKALSQAVYDDDRLFFAAGGGVVYAVSAVDGRVLWRFPLEAEIDKQVSVYKDKVFAGSHDGRVYAIDKQDGTEVWNVLAEGRVRCTPIVSDGVLSVTSENGYVYSIRPSNGEILWKRRLDTKLSNLAVSQGMIFVKSSDEPTWAVTKEGIENRIYVLDKGTGRLYWQRDFPDAIYGEMLVSDGVLYVGGRFAWMYAFNVARNPLSKTRRSDIWLAKGVAYTAKRQWRDAVKALEKSLRFNPTNQTALWRLAEIHHEVGNVAEEIEVLQNYAAVLADDPSEEASARQRVTELSKLLWRFPVGTPDGLLGIFSPPSSPLVHQDMLFIGSPDGYVYAIDRKRGELRWEFQTHGGVYTTPALLGGILYAGSRDPDSESGYVYALDARSGRLRWQSELARGISRVIASENYLVVMNGGGDLYCLEASGGTIIWSRQSQGSYYSHPITDGQMVYAIDAAGFLAAFEVSSGDLKWKFDLPRGTDEPRAISLHPVVYGDNLYVGIEDGLLYVLDPATGSLKRKLRFVDIDISPRSNFIVDEGAVYVGSRGKNLLALDLETEKVNWQFRMDADVSPIIKYEGLIVAGAGGLLSHDKHIYVVTAEDGILKWKFKTGGDVLARPTFAEGILYAYSADGYLYAFDLSDIDQLMPVRDASYYLNRGTVAYVNGDAAEAIKALEVYNEFKPSDATVLRMLEQSHSKLGNHESAARLLEESLAVYKDKGIYLRLGVTYARLGEYDKATERFAVFRMFLPEKEQEKFSFDLASLYVREGFDGNEILRLVEDAISRNPRGKPPYYLLRGSIYEQRGMSVEAKADYDLALELAIASGDEETIQVTQEQRGSLLHDQLFQYEDAYEIFNELHRMNPESTSSQLNLMEVAFTTERFHEAIRRAVNVRRELGDNDAFHVVSKFFELGAYVMTNQKNEAVRAAEALVDLYGSLRTDELNWSFAGTKHFLEISQHPYARLILRVVEVLEKGFSEEGRVKLKTVVEVLSRSS